MPAYKRAINIPVFQILANQSALGALPGEYSPLKRTNKFLFQAPAEGMEEAKGGVRELEMAGSAGL